MQVELDHSSRQQMMKLWATSAPDLGHISAGPHPERAALSENSDDVMLYRVTEAYCRLITSDTQNKKDTTSNQTKTHTHTHTHTHTKIQLCLHQKKAIPWQIPGRHCSQLHS